MYSHILIATDGSELAKKGVDQGLELAAKIGAKVTIVSVTPPIDPRAVLAATTAGVKDLHSGYDRAVRGKLKKRFASIQQRTADKAVAVEFAHQIDEYPAEAIVRLAGNLDCDLIVMSSHGRRGVRRFILGSQTAEVVTHTTIPVLVVR